MQLELLITQAMLAHVQLPSHPAGCAAGGSLHMVWPPPLLPSTVPHQGCPLCRSRCFSTLFFSCTRVAAASTRASRAGDSAALLPASWPSGSAACVAVPWCCCGCCSGSGSPGACMSAAAAGGVGPSCATSSALCRPSCRMQDSRYSTTAWIHQQEGQDSRAPRLVYTEVWCTTAS